MVKVFKKAKALAFLAVTFFSLSAFNAPLFAKGNIHIIIIVSKSDPTAKESNTIWQERIAGAMTGDIPEFYVSSVHRYDSKSSAANSYGGLKLGMNGVETFEVLEGPVGSNAVDNINNINDPVHPVHILKVCEEVSQKAGPDDAIAVFMVSHGGFVVGEDGVNRHALAPLAVSRDNLQLSMGEAGIKRGSIMRALKTKQHRLVVLVTDSCAGVIKVPKPVDPQSGNFNYHSGPYNLVFTEHLSILPRDKSYLLEFLSKAEGEVNINSTDSGELAEFNLNPNVQSVDNLEGGTRFSNAFVALATEGYYLNSELNPEGFYKLLNLRLTQEIARANSDLRNDQTYRQTLTRFTHDSRKKDAVKLRSKECDKISADRFKEMEKSGEFKKSPLAKN